MYNLQFVHDIRLVSNSSNNATLRHRRDANLSAKCFQIFPAIASARFTSRPPPSLAPWPPLSAMSPQIGCARIVCPDSDVRREPPRFLSKCSTPVRFRVRPLWRSEEHTSELQSRLHLVC